MVTSLTSISPFMKSAAEEALLAEAKQRGEAREDTESFNEDECLFMEGGLVDAEERHEGAFSHYSMKAANPIAVHTYPNSVYYHQEDENFSHFNGLHNSVHLHHMRLHPKCTVFSSYDERSSALRTSPDTKLILRRSRREKKSSLSVRESLLTEAWERKRELMLNEELANFKETATPELLGRSSSDSGKISAEKVQGLCHELRRSQARSLTDDDFEELRGCIDLGFRFDQSSIPDLCDTLPALEVYCAVAQSLQESPTSMPLNSPVRQSPTQCSSPSPTPSWRVSSPGDDPRDVKGRLKHWAQAVACDARLCY